MHHHLFVCEILFTCSVTDTTLSHLNMDDDDDGSSLIVTESYQLGEQTTSDATVLLKNNQLAKCVQLRCHSSVLAKHSRFFAERLLPNKCIEVSCAVLEYDHYVKLFKLLYISDSVLDSLGSVKSALGVLRACNSLCCEAIAESCVQYLEAMPWDENEEEEILEIVPKLGTVAAAPLLARFQAADLISTKSVFISAIRFATNQSFAPLFTDELRVSAQEQVDYMLTEDEDTPLVAVDEEVKSEAKAGLANIFASFKTELGNSFETEQRLLQCMTDLDWICNIVSKMDLMTDFVSQLACISDQLLAVVLDDKHKSGLWGLKVRLVELVAKALDAIGFGNVVLPAASRACFLKTWLPYLRTMKPVLDAKTAAENEVFPYKMDADLCQNIQGAIVSLILALPSGEQAEILGDWMKRSTEEEEELRFPDLTEAFEVWVYRTKAAKRRLVAGIGNAGSNNHAVVHPAFNKIPN